MLATTETLVDKGFSEQVLKNWSFNSVFEGTAASQQALLHKALKKNEIVHVCRGVYILGQKYRSSNLSKYFIANQIIPQSYVSFDTALSYHNFIPERVNLIMSVTPKGRTRSFQTPLGEFQYIRIPVNTYEFLNGVSRVELRGKPFLIADPLRALADYVYIRKMSWQGLTFLTESLRIEEEALELLDSKAFNEILLVYRSKRVLSFLLKLREELGK